MTKTRAELVAELTESMKDTPAFPDLPISTFVEAAVDLIEAGKATWDGENLILTQGTKQ